MTDVVRADSVEPIRHDPASELVAWARAAEAAAELARPLSQTAFVPEVYQGKPGDAAAAILVGAEVGLSPMQALQGIYVIKGKPAMYARTLMAIVLAAGHEVWTDKAGPDRCVVKGRRRGSEKVETSDWPIGRAQQAGYTSNAKYKTDPESMLLARAQAECCRRVAPDAILGMAYSVEELEDDAPEAKSGKRTVQRKAATPAPELPAVDDTPFDRPQPVRGKDNALRKVDDVNLPPLPEEGEGEYGDGAPTPPENPRQQADPPSPPPTAREGDRPGYATKAQLRMLRALEGEAGVTDRDVRLARYTQMAGRPIATSNDLTRIEAKRLIDRYVAESGQGDLLEPPEDGGE